METEGKESWFKMLDRLFDRCFIEGWELDGGKDRVFPDRIYIDSRYNRPQSRATDDVFVIDEWIASLDKCRFDKMVNKKEQCRFCKHISDTPIEKICAVRSNPYEPHRELFRMVMGLGASERDGRKYAQKSGKDVTAAGNGWHHLIDREKHRSYFLFDADRSKLQIQNRFFMPVDTPGTLQLYLSDNVQEHHRFALSITAKRLLQVNDKDRWETIRRDDHLLDSTGIAFVGIEIENTKPKYDGYENIIHSTLTQSGY